MVARLPQVSWCCKLHVAGRERRIEVAVEGHVSKYPGWSDDFVVLLANPVCEVVAGGLEVRLMIDLGGRLPSSGVVLAVLVDDVQIAGQTKVIDES